MKNKLGINEHVCKYTKVCTTLDKLYPPHLKNSKTKRACRELFLVSEKNGRKCYTPQGKAGYIAEKEKQLNEPIFMIHPYSKFREVWEIFAIIEICLSLLLRPLIASECKKNYWCGVGYQLSALLADLFETTDVIMLFFVGFMDKETGNVVFTFRKIFFHRVLDLFMIINVIVSFPFEFFSYLLCCVFKIASSTFILRNVVFIKILKLHLCVKYLGHIAKIYNWSEWCSVLVWTIICDFFMCHWLTCCYHQISYSKVYKTSDKNATLSRAADGFFLHYTKIFYSVSCTLLNKNVVLRKISSYTFEDNFFWYFAITTLYFCSLVTFGLLILYLALLRNSGVFYEETKQEIQKFLVQENLPRHVHKKVMKYLQFRYRNNYFVEELIFKTLSPPLRREVASFLCIDLLTNPKSIFTDLPTDLAMDVCLLMVYEVFLPGDIIFRAGDKPVKIYFLYSGSVAVYSARGKEVMHWYEGQQFGVSAFIPNVVHPASVLALEMSECYSLRYKDFLKVASPENVKIVMKAARDRRQYVLGLYSED